MSDRFVYVTYIRTTPEKLWDALTLPEFTRAYWFGAAFENELKTGASWRMSFPDGHVGASGKVVEAVKPRRLVLDWRSEYDAEARAEGIARCTMELAPETAR